jgi:hypothetical protein
VQVARGSEAPVSPVGNDDVGSHPYDDLSRGLKPLAPRLMIIYGGRPIACGRRPEPLAFSCHRFSPFLGAEPIHMTMRRRQSRALPTTCRGESCRRPRRTAGRKFTILRRANDLQACDLRKQVS